ncbi:PepSY domain-containing protein [Mycetocola sp. 2940]|uniref:PepSY domain-containing protein n=1 Tax=Mycetocola sp. 2940 TaxID=3156452 RepID=UPI003394C8D5
MKKKTVIIGSALAAVLVLGGTGAAVAVSGSNAEDDKALTGSTLEKASKAALAETGEGKVTDSESDDGGYEVEVTLDNGSAVDLWLNSSFEVVRVDSDDSSDDDGTDDTGDSAVTDEERTSAEAAALAEAPGTVTEVDRSDDGASAFEVEITREDGTEVEVELDEDFAVVNVDDSDDKGSDDKGSDDN